MLTRLINYLSFVSTIIRFLLDYLHFEYQHPATNIHNIIINYTYAPFQLLYRKLILVDKLKMIIKSIQCFRAWFKVY